MENYECEIRPAHDRKKVEIWADSESGYLTPQDARSLASKLMEVADFVEKNEPKAPSPLFRSDGEKDPLAESLEFNAKRGYGVVSVGGWELYEENMDKLMEWLLKAKKYFNECRNGKL